MDCHLIQTFLFELDSSSEVYRLWSILNLIQSALLGENGGYLGVRRQPPSLLLPWTWQDWITILHWDVLVQILRSHPQTHFLWCARLCWICAVSHGVSLSSILRATSWCVLPINTCLLSCIPYQCHISRVHMDGSYGYQVHVLHPAQECFNPSCNQQRQLHQQALDSRNCTMIASWHLQWNAIICMELWTGFDSDACTWWCCQQYWALTLGLLSLSAGNSKCFRQMDCLMSPLESQSFSVEAAGI